MIRWLQIGFSLPHCKNYITISPVSILIRKAELSDIDFILVELKKFSDFFNSKHQLFGPDEHYNRSIIERIINDHIFFVADKSGAAVGFIAGTITNHLFNPSIKVLTEVFWWVVESERRSSAGARLFNRFVEFGKASCNWIVMTLEEISQVKKESILSRGFSLKETSFLMEV